jgi:hypothetical protein
MAGRQNVASGRERAFIAQSRGSGQREQRRPRVGLDSRTAYSGATRPLLELAHPSGESAVTVSLERDRNIHHEKFYCKNSIAVGLIR